MRICVSPRRWKPVQIYSAKARDKPVHLWYGMTVAHEYISKIHACANNALRPRRYITRSGLYAAIANTQTSSRIPHLRLSRNIVQENEVYGRCVHYARSVHFDWSLRLFHRGQFSSWTSSTSHWRSSEYSNSSVQRPGHGDRLYFRSGCSPANGSSITLLKSIFTYTLNLRCCFAVTVAILLS